jgi:chromosome segregation ATPase
MEESFKSPIKKLNKFFQRSRDLWKERAKRAIQEIRGYKKRILFLESSKESLKSNNKQLKEQINALEKELNSIKKNLESD